MTPAKAAARTEERLPRSTKLHEKSIPQILKIINTEDKKVAEAVSGSLGPLARAVRAFIKSYRCGGRIFFVGAGTSGRLGVLEAVECSPTFGTPSERIQGLLAGGEAAFFQAQENYEDRRAMGKRLVKERRIRKEDLLVLLSASGETPFVLGCLEAAKAMEIQTVGITSNPDSALAKLVVIPIVLPVGPEVVAGSTRMKAGTAQKLALNMLTTTAMVKLGKVHDNLMIDLRAHNRKLRRRAEAILTALAEEKPANIKRVLRETNYQVKPALLMLKGGIPLPKARELLKKHQGALGKALEELQVKA